MQDGVLSKTKTFHFRFYIVKMLEDTSYSSERNDRNRESTDMCYTIIHVYDLTRFF